MTAAVEEQAQARTGGLSADLLEEQIKGNHLTANHHRAWMLDAVGQFDEQQLAEQLLKQAKEQGVDLRQDKLALQRLKEEAEKAKKELSSTTQYEVNLPFITMNASGPLHLNIKLSRAKLEALVEDLVARTIEPCRIALKDAGIDVSKINDVILVGGQTRMPLVQQKVAEFFGKEARKDVNPDEAVAMGAAIQGAVLAGDVAAAHAAHLAHRARADRDQLYRVLANLARNARQAIEATRRPGTIEISAAEDESHWCIRVGDTGPGLPQKARENLFQPFTGGIRKGGTGLGLAIAADLVRGHGGSLELVRSDAEGTEFLLRLPLPRARARRRSLPA